MTCTHYPIKHLTRAAFSAYGTILGHYQTTDGYESVVTVESTGWMWAIKTFHNVSIDQIDSHPDTKESFEPVWGTSRPTRRKGSRSFSSTSRCCSTSACGTG
jgi:ureidoglycolate hydrolase